MRFGGWEYLGSHVTLPEKQDPLSDNLVTWNLPQAGLFAAFACLIPFSKRMPLRTTRMVYVASAGSVIFPAADFAEQRYNRYALEKSGQRLVPRPKPFVSNVGTKIETDDLVIAGAIVGLVLSFNPRVIVPGVSIWQRRFGFAALGSTLFMPFGFATPKARSAWRDYQEDRKAVLNWHKQYDAKSPTSKESQPRIVQMGFFSNLFSSGGGDDPEDDVYEDESQFITEGQGPHPIRALPFSAPAYVAGDDFTWHTNTLDDALRILHEHAKELQEDYDELELAHRYYMATRSRALFDMDRETSLADSTLPKKLMIMRAPRMLITSDWAYRMRELTWLISDTNLMILRVEAKRRSLQGAPYERIFARWYSIADKMISSAQPDDVQLGWLESPTAQRIEKVEDPDEFQRWMINYREEIDKAQAHLEATTFADDSAKLECAQAALRMTRRELSEGIAQISFAYQNATERQAWSLPETIKWYINSWDDLQGTDLNEVQDDMFLLCLRGTRQLEMAAEKDVRELQEKRWTIQENK